MFSLPLEVEKSITINKPATEVKDYLADFNRWPLWSPWLCQEPGCPFKVTGPPGEIGHHQRWEGEMIGIGEMTLKSISGSRLDYDLSFLKPWKSEAKVHFEITGSGDSCKVTWGMQGSIPIFLFFLKKLMTAMVGSDYERGLDMLRDQLENGKVLSKIEHGGIKERKGFEYVGLRFSGGMDQVGPKMEEQFIELSKRFPEEPLFVFAIYHKFDFVNCDVDFTSGFAFSDIKNKDTKGVETGSLPPHKALTVDHFGDYKNLGNGWSAVMACQRSKRHKQNKSVPMYEIYHNDPDDTETKDIHTEICLPVK